MIAALKAAIARAIADREAATVAATAYAWTMIAAGHGVGPFSGGPSAQAIIAAGPARDVCRAYAAAVATAATDAEESASYRAALAAIRAARESGAISDLAADGAHNALNGGEDVGRAADAWWNAARAPRG